jgi:hypothetical protein
MTELTPDLQNIRSMLLAAATRDARRRASRRKAVRVCAIGATGVLALSGSALAAGDLLGVIDLGGGLHAQEVNSYPAYDVSTHRFVQMHGDYVYHVTGGHVRGLTACPTHENDIYIESSGPLTEPQLQLAAELANGGEESPLIKSLGGYQKVHDEIPGLTGVSDGCGNAGVERIVGAGPQGAAAGAGSKAAQQAARHGTR